jgi:membrane associated rhomboid family serine protease
MRAQARVLCRVWVLRCYVPPLLWFLVLQLRAESFHRTILNRTEQSGPEMLIPVGHDSDDLRHFPVVTLSLIVINVVVFLLTLSSLHSNSPELKETIVHIRLLAANHPELQVPPSVRSLISDFQKREPKVWEAAKNPNRDLYDAWDAKMRLMEDPGVLQEEMDRLAARYSELRESSLVSRYAYVPANPTWYSYITANFLHGGWMHLIGNMWFLWLAGILLEDAWGRPLYIAVYMMGGITAILVHGLMNAGSNVPMLGASGAIAALMGAFLVRFPKIRIEMMFFAIFSIYGLFRVKRFFLEAFWLLPIWFLLEVFNGALVGSHSSVAHWAHAGGFVFGVAAAFAIKSANLEHKREKLDDEEAAANAVDHDFEQIEEFVAQDQSEEALRYLEHYLSEHADSEKALLLKQSLELKANNNPGYLVTTERLCRVHLEQNATDLALNDFANFLEAGGQLLSAETWFEVARALEREQQYERAIGEYQDLAHAHTDNRKSISALLAAAKLCLKQVKRPQQALNLYHAAAQSSVPHLDLEAEIQSGIKQATQLAAAPAIAG